MNGNLLNEAPLDEELRDIQGYQAVVIPSYIWWILLVLVLALVSYFVYKYIQSKKRKIELSVFEKTIAELDALDLKTESKAFYLDYSDIVRNYILETLDLNLFDKTLNEVKELLNEDQVFDIKSRTELLDIFSKADMAKFAKQDVAPEKRLLHIQNTKTILEKVEADLEIEGEEAELNDLR